jgi:hypothetical protein
MLDGSASAQGVPPCIVAAGLDGSASPQGVPPCIVAELVLDGSASAQGVPPCIVAELGAAADAACATDVPLEQQFAFGLRQAAPDSIRLADVQGVRTALSQHWAAAAHLLGAAFTLEPGPAALAVGVEEHRRIHAAAKAL